MRILCTMVAALFLISGVAAHDHRAQTGKLIELLPLYATDKGGSYVVEIYDLIGNRTHVSYGSDGQLTISYVEYEIGQMSDGTYRGRQNQVTFIDADGSGIASSIQSVPILRPGAEVEQLPVDAGNQALYVDLVQDVIDYLENLKPESTKKA